MLVLQRKKQESILIGEDIRVTVLECGSDGVKIAIEAPKEISILREELAEAAKVNQEAVPEQKLLSNIKQFLHREKMGQRDKE